MCSCCPPAPRTRSTFPEALVALVALLGYVVPLSLTRTVQPLLAYALVLAVTALFYFLLLLARMLYFWMTGGERGYGQLEHAGYDEQGCCGECGDGCCQGEEEPK